mmetsp:Transcript_2075/g.3411  ORF Transcript_2075/g.3411 Transcript_2075/m.3411 type:complete len:1085 (-) Transcript_2075:47-3301(-)|eukprot:CAMPEP_0184542084 /NCGR_PEP_ID=MMETSP0199_2-20130426/1780_1 /TAXON_ID=1112570 /ORGANISM="Thraustochytrium sp., Strain LLF1b" /LENGTH=1084 /DNA_ID=CAMNT_0026935849 /DNA_START=182 /DNA_END=3436 /DNA_ORIENTATION=+
MSLKIDAAFWVAARELHALWKKEVWGGAGAIVVGCGKPRGDAEEDRASTPSESVSKMLFDGLLVTNTLVVMTDDKIILAASGAKKTGIFNDLKAQRPEGVSLEVEVVELPKKEPGEAFDKLVEQLKEITSGDKKKVATLLEDPVGVFATEWKAKLDNAGIPLMDAWPGLQCLVSLANTKTRKLKAQKTSQLALRAMKKVFFKTMMDTFEEEESKSNAEVAKRIADHLRNPAKMKAKDYNADEVFVPYAPTVQSGGEYKVDTLNAPSNEHPLTSDVLICQFSVGYDDFVTVIGRTHMFNARKSQEKAYKTMYEAHELLVKSLKPGAVLGEVYDAVRELVQTKAPELIENFPKSLGFGTGWVLEYPALKIESGSTQTVANGMAFVISTYLKDLTLTEAELAKAKKNTLKDGRYSIVITDTIIVGSKVDTPPEVLTEKFKADYDDIHYEVPDSDEEESDDEDDEDEDDDAEVINGPGAKLASAYGSRERVTRSQTKTPEQLAAENEARLAEGRIQKQQSELMKKKAKRALKKLGQQGENDGDNNDDEDDDDEELSANIVKVYPKGSREYPRELIRNQIYCDKEREAVLLPIGGFHVPFHISSIKSVLKDNEKAATVVRIKFHYPTGGHTFNREVPNSMRTLMTQFPQMNFIKELTFRSRSQRNLTHQHRLIKEMIKRARARQKTIEQEADLVEQLDLEVLTKKRPPQLDRISMKPTMRKGKCVGYLQAHANGFRFRSSKNETFDLIYANVKHFFFQECKQDLTVLVHFHLKHPVMVGRTKTYDIQFYTEVIEASTASEGKRGNLVDPDEEEEERREQKYKRDLNQKFKKFCQDVVGLCNDLGQPLGVDNEYDRPYRKLSFKGVPNKEMVTLSPTVHCLVNLTETPFFVVTLDEIEHIHFERVSSGTKSFDMVIILKSHMQPTSGDLPQRITSIPIESLTTIRHWLHDKGDITFTAGNRVLNWRNVMDAVYPAIEMGVFWKPVDIDGEKKEIGWNILRFEDDDDESASDVSEESDFAASDAQSSDEDEDDWENEMDEDDSSDGSDMDDEDEGESWDELERKAIEDDSRKVRRDRQNEDESERPKKRKK